MELTGQLTIQSLPPGRLGPKDNSRWYTMMNEYIQMAMDREEWRKAQMQQEMAM